MFSSSRFWLVFPPILFTILGFLLYFQSIFFGITYSDDNVLVLEKQPFFSNLANIPKTFLDDDFQNQGQGTYYRPLVMSSFILDTQWKSPNSYVAYHITNILLLVVAAWLTFFLFCILGFPKSLSLLSAILFLVHPGNNQSVAWMTGRVDTILTIFVLSSLLFFIRFFRTKDLLSALFSLFFLVTALFTKETAIMLPLIFVEMAVVLEAQKSTSSFFSQIPSILLLWRKKKQHTFFWFGGVTLLLTACWFFLRNIAIAPSIQGVKESHLFTFENIILLFHNLPFLLPHLGKIVLPINLSPYHVAEDMLFLPGLFSLLLLGTFGWFFRKRIHFLIVLFGMTWFALFLIPTFLNPDSEQEKAFFENRLTLPMVGILLIFLEYSRAIWKQRKSLLYTFWGIITLLFATLSFWNIGYYKDGISYWKRAVETSPHASFAWNNLGAMSYLSGEKEVAKSHWKRALQENAKEKLVNANLGLLAMEEGKTHEAEQYFLQELKIDQFSEKGNINLALLYANTGRLPEAKKILKSFLVVFPDHEEARNMLFQITSFENQQSSKKNKNL